MITQRPRLLLSETLESRKLLAGGGLLGQYYDSNDLSGTPAIVRTDANVDFDWAAGSPGSAISTDNFSARWSGQIEANFTEPHSFIVNANDGARLWVNGQLLIDQFDAGNLIDASATIDLVAGRRYEIQLDFREAVGEAGVSLEWSSPSTAREVIPQNQLFASERGGISFARFDDLNSSEIDDLRSNTTLLASPDTTATLTAFETTNNAAAENSGASVGQQIQGRLHTPKSGDYTFYVAADNQAELWLSNTPDAEQSVQIVELTSAVSPLDFTANAQQQSATVHLVQGQTYFIKALTVGEQGSGHLAVAWQLPGSNAIEVIPGTNLSPVLPTVKAYAQQPVVSESSATPARLTVVRDGSPLSEPLTVQYDVSGSAQNGTDYQLLPGAVTIPAGQRSVTVEISPAIDALTEGDETIEFTLTDGVGYDVGQKSEREVLVTLQDDRDAPATGQALWNGVSLSDFQRFGANFGTENVAGVGNVIQARIESQPNSEFSSQLRQAIDQPVSAGDILYLEFRVRSLGGPGIISAIFEDVVNFDKSLSKGIEVTTQWQRVQLPFTALTDYAIGEATAGFHLGFQAQTLQFTDLQLQNFGPPKLLAPEASLQLNNINGFWGTSQTIAVTGQTFDDAHQVQTLTVPPQSWRLQAIETNQIPVKNGDTMQLNFSIRAIAGNAPQAHVQVARINDSFSGLFGEHIPVTGEWVEHTFQIDADQNYDAGDLRVAISLGQGLQTIEIGGFNWQNIDNAIALEDLPRQVAAVSYGGRDGDDAWRTEADARIDSIRKSNVTVNVVDNANQAIDGAVVNLRQTKHDFRFGSAISAFNGRLDPGGNASALKYQSEIKRLFNAAVSENSLKWPQIIDNEARALQLVDFAENNDIFLRGHVGIWPSRNNMPASVWNQYDSLKESDGTVAANAWLQATIEDHLDYLADTFRGRITEWDVANELFTNHDVMDILGDQVVVEWFQRFRDADPNVELALNDFQIFASNGNNTLHRNDFDSWLQLLSDANLLDVIGEQSHYGETNLTDIATLGQLITTYSTEYSAPVAITEFDVNTTDLQLQADYLRDYMTMSFSQSGVNQFLHWGFWEDAHWLPHAALYRSDFSIKPNGQAYEDLVFGNWWTDTTGTTRSGAVSSEAFHGQYDVLVQYNGQNYNATVEVDDSGTSNVTVVLTDIGEPTLTIAVADQEIAELDGVMATTATVTRTGDLSNEVVVDLSSSDNGEATLPSSVTILAGQSSSPAFAINAIDDGVPDTAKTVTLTASATGFDAGTSQISVIDVLSHRLSNLTVTVQDSLGNPIPDAIIDIQMNQHAFQFGTQVQDRFLTITEPEFNALATWQKHNLIGDYDQVLPTPVWQDAVNYRTAVYDNFNHIIPTNGIQWVEYRDKGPAALDRTIEAATARGLSVTGHAVVWQNDHWPTPPEFQLDANPNPQIFYDALIDERLSGKGIMARFSELGDGPNVLDWDVLNEPLHETYYSDTFVDAGIYASANHAFADYFIRADAIRPDAKLAINDFNILSSGGDAAAMQYRDLVIDLLALGAPIDQIKVQAHMSQVISKADATRRLDILAETGLPIAISEFDMRDDANQISAANQETLFRNILEAAFEHPAVNGFSMWGIWDSAHWRGNGPLFDADWNVKDEASPWFDLVQGQWKTNLINLDVDNEGQWTSHDGLFQGEYQITASNGITSTTVDKIDVTSDGEIIITLTSSDFGDAPSSYGTLLADNGARHIAAGPQLGELRNAEAEGVPSSLADSDDDDGVLFGEIGVNSNNAAINVELVGGEEARVDAWIDFNRDGIWDATEKVLDSVLVDQPMQTLNYDLPENVSTGPTYARVRLSTDGGLGPSGPAADGEVEDYLIDIIKPPVVESVQINGGDAQRSSLDSLRVTFDSVVQIDAADGEPFELVEIDSGNVILVNSAIDHSGQKTVVVLTFDPSDQYVTSFGSLINGDYRLTIDSSRISTQGIHLDGNKDGSAGDSYQIDARDGLFRKYGDADGNGSVSLVDFAAFRATFGRTAGDDDFLSGLDSDGDGSVSLVDFAAFRGSFGT
jgi:GH35 family endo-1,4-beta-xylanase